MVCTVGVSVFATRIQFKGALTVHGVKRNGTLYCRRVYVRYLRSI